MNRSVDKEVKAVEVGGECGVIGRVENGAGRIVVSSWDRVVFPADRRSKAECPSTGKYQSIRATMFGILTSITLSLTETT